MRSDPPSPRFAGGQEAASVSQRDAMAGSSVSTDPDNRHGSSWKRLRLLPHFFCGEDLIDPTPPGAVN